MHAAAAADTKHILTILEVYELIGLKTVSLAHEFTDILFGILNHKVVSLEENLPLTLHVQI